MTTLGGMTVPSKEVEQIYQAIRKAEDNFFRPFEHTKQLKLAGKNVRIFVEPYATSEAIYGHYRLNWHDRLADELATAAVDWSLTQKGRGLVANPEFETFSIQHLSDEQLRITSYDMDKAKVEAYLDDDLGKQHHLEYVMIRDRNRNWIIQQKSVRNN